MAASHLGQAHGHRVFSRLFLFSYTKAIQAKYGDPFHYSISPGSYAGRDRLVDGKKRACTRKIVRGPYPVSHTFHGSTLVAVLYFMVCTWIINPGKSNNH
jgi:hypothetical protein